METNATSKQIHSISKASALGGEPPKANGLNWTIRKKMVAFLLMAGLLPLSIFALFSMQRVETAILQINQERLISLREEKKLQIEQYFDQIKNQVETYSNNRMIIDAVQEFTPAFFQAESVSSGNYGLAEKQRLRDRYTYQLQNTPGAPGNAMSTWFPKKNITQLFQSLYISENSNPIGEKEKLNHAGDPSAYSNIHRKYHGIIRDYLERFGYYDIFLVDPRTGHIVYSVFKEVDYATSLLTGPYADTGIGRAFKAAAQAKSADFVIMDDFAPYAPSYNAAAAFIASPIFDGNKKVGVLIFQAPIDRIDGVMTSNKAWKKVGLGDSGEVYMVGQDFKMRNNSRFLIEQPKEYFKALEALKIEKILIQKSRDLETSIGLNQIKTEGTANALQGKTGFAIYNDYRGAPVLGAYSPLSILGHQWGILAEIDEAEAMQVTSDLWFWTVVIFGGLTVLLILSAFYIAGWFSKPVLTLVDRAEEIANGNLKQEALRIDSSDELGLLGNSFNKMIESLNRLVRKAEHIAEGKLQLNKMLEKMNSGMDLESGAQAVSSEDKIHGDLGEAFLKMETELRKLTVQAKTIAEDDLNNPILKVQIAGELGEQFRAMNEKMQWFAGQADYIAKNDVNNSDLKDDGSGTLGSAMGTMVKNLRELLKTTQDQADRERKQAKELQEKVDSLLGVVNAAAEGDLTQKVTVQGADAIGQMGAGLSKFLDKLRTSISSIGENSKALDHSSSTLSEVSQQMAGNAEETSAQAGVVSAASEEVSKNVETVATGAEEMHASIKEISSNANDAAKIAADAVRVAENTNKTVGKLGESSAEIGQVIKVITSIAEQTNLLALNATIEAARAGEAGKGFAVVANEVKDLANQTAKATEEISAKIEAIQTDTGGAVSAIAEISEVISKISDISNTIASAVEEQTATTSEIGRNVTEAAKGTQEIAENITGVATAAQSTTQGAGDTQTASGELSNMASELQKLVAQFKY